METLLTLSIGLLIQMLSLKIQSKDLDRREEYKKLQERLRQDREDIHKACETFLAPASRKLKSISPEEKDALSKIFVDQDGVLTKKIQQVLFEQKKFDNQAFQDAFKDAIDHYAVDNKLDPEKWKELFQETFDAILLVAANHDGLSHYILLIGNISLLNRLEELCDKFSAGLEKLASNQRVLYHEFKETKARLIDVFGLEADERACRIMLVGYKLTQLEAMKKRQQDKLTGKHLELAEHFPYIEPKLYEVPADEIPVEKDKLKGYPSVSHDRLCEMLEGGDRVLVIAEAGVGKTTFINEIFLRFLERCYPGRVPLRTEARDLFNEGDLYKFLNTRGGFINISPLWSRGRLLVLLDSLDQTDRPFTVTGVDLNKYFLDEYSGNFKNNSLLVCCRHEEVAQAADRFQTAFKEFRCIYLARMEQEEEIPSYLGDEIKDKWWSKIPEDTRKLLGVRYYANKFKVLYLKGELKSGERISRTVLLQKSLNSVLKSERMRQLTAEIGRKKAIERLEKYLNKLALATLCADKKQQFPSHFLDMFPEYDDARKLLDRSHIVHYLNQEIFDIHGQNRIKRKDIQEQNRIKRKKEEMVSFQHQILQEYLAACELQRLFYDKKRDGSGGLADNLKELPYNEVVRDILDELLSDSPESQGAGALDWEVYRFCMDEIKAALVRVSPKKPYYVPKNFLTWVLALRDLKARRPEIGAELEQEFEKETKASQQGAEKDPVFARVPAGPFLMGSWEYEEERYVHAVYLPEFWIARRAVSFSEFEARWKKTGKPLPTQYLSACLRYGIHDDNGRLNPRWEKKPVIFVSWEDAVCFCREAEALPALELPTEAQWEKAARGRLGRRFPWGNGPPDESVANIAKPYQGEIKTVDVDKYSGHVHGLEQMAGNVWEWCHDVYDREAYKRREKSDPDNPEKNESGIHSLRGGSWYYYRDFARCSYRLRTYPTTRFFDLGFRCVRTLK